MSDTPPVAYWEEMYRGATDRVLVLERCMLVAIVLIEQGRFADAQRKLASALPEQDQLLPASNTDLR